MYSYTKVKWLQDLPICPETKKGINDLGNSFKISQETSMYAYKHTNIYNLSTRRVSY